MLPGVNLEVEEEQQQERGDAIDHEVAVGEVILKWSKVEMLIFIIHIHTMLENTINILQVNRSWKVSDTKFLKLITSEHYKYKYL